MFSTPSQYTNYKIRGKSRHLHYPYCNFRYINLKDMFSTPSQYTNYKIRGKSRHLHYPYYGLYTLVTVLYLAT